jgi:hypothetical protein
MKNQIFPFVVFTRAQRDGLSERAKETGFVKNSVMNGCRIWTRHLLSTLMDGGILSREVFEEVDVGTAGLRQSESES